MTLKNRLRKLESSVGPTECECPKIIKFAIGDAEPTKLCARCANDLRTGKSKICVVVPTLESLPAELQNHRGKIYAGFDLDRV
jgi:hypothetical protein